MSFNRVSSHENLAQEMQQCIADLFPYHRSITGDGLRQSLNYLQKYLPLEIHEVRTGTEVLDWQIPPEWRIRDAYIADLQGNRIVDYQHSNLQVMAYSQPVAGTMDFTRLAEHLHRTMEANDPHQHSDWIPYRTLYFREGWGFCVSQRQWDRLQQNPGEQFKVQIDAEFFAGSLTYGEAFFPGQSDQTILVYAHCCHPSLANDNLSGMAVAAFLGQRLQQRIERGEKLAKSYRIVLAPATIGAIAWLAQNRSRWNEICGGLVLSLLGADGAFTYKQSRQSSENRHRQANTLATIDRAARLAFQEGKIEYQERPFAPLGYDERQFCSPGINLPIGCLMRTPAGEFPQYHTSGDNLEFIQSSQLIQSLQVAESILQNLESNRLPISRRPFGEPQLGLHGLYRAYGQQDSRGQLPEAVLWVQNWGDGEHDLLGIAQRSGLPMQVIVQAAELLQQHQLLDVKEA